MNTKTRLQFASTFLMVTLIGSPVLAEGFFTKLFGSDSSTGANAFKALISHVPADTSFLFTNQKAIPEDVMDFHIKRSQNLFKLISKQSSKSKKNKTESLKNSPEAFFSAFFEDLSEKFAIKKLEETGLTLDTNFIIYGVDMTPVMRLSIADKEKLMATLRRAEVKSGYKIELTKCGDFDCMIDSAKKDTSMALVLLKNQLVASVFNVDKKDAVIKHLTGKIPEKDAYKTESWESFLKDNLYTGHGEGFINLQKLYEKGSPLIVHELQKDKRLSDEELKNCLLVAEDHIKNMPEVIFGTKSLTAQKMDYELVLKTSEDVSKVLQSIANEKNIEQRAENAIFDLGLNINFIKLRDALTQYSDFLIKSAETHKCKNIKAADIRKGMGGLMMGMNMGLTQFKSLYVAVDDIKLDKRMKPEKVDAYVSIGADDPAGLLGMVSMFSPSLMGFKVPADGTAVKLPEGAIPTRGIQVPPIYLSRTDKTLNLMVGNDKPALKKYNNDIPAIMVMGMDSKRYYEKLSSIMPKGSASSDQAAMNMLTSIGDMAGNIQQEISADKRGLAFNYHVQYNDIKEAKKNAEVVK